jgi:hypothetical protein
VPGCREAGPTAEITERRTASKPSKHVVPGATAAQRFGEPESDVRPDASDDMVAFDYDLPEGWVAVAPTRERHVNLRPAGDPEAECYLSIIPGGGGGLEANVNRWRGQLGAEPLTAAEIAALPRSPLFGRDATLVEVEGTYKGMGGTTPRAGFKLLGLAISEPEFGLFLKFTAPSGLVELEREHFLAFARTLRLAEGDAHGGHHEGDGHDHSGATGEPGAAAAGRLTWEVPPGWSVESPRMTGGFRREVSFALPGGAECYVMRLLGDGGGLRANLDRWCDQLGHEPLTEQTLAALERVEMLGEKVPLLELEGSFTGMDGKTRAGQGLLGAACIRPGESLFVKLTGPQAVVHAERASFLAFVGSLEETP